MGRRLTLKHAVSRRAIGILLSFGPLTGFADDLPVPPVRQVIDETGVDLLTGTFTASQSDISIGPSDGSGLSYARAATSQNNTFGYRANTDVLLKFFDFSQAPDGVPYVAVTTGFSKDKFSQSGSTFTATDGMGTTLVLDGATQNYIYTQRDGTVIRFPAATANEDYDGIRASSIEAPDGTRTEFHIKKWTETFCGSGCPTTYSRVQSITNNAGYQLKFEYTDTVNKKLPAKVSVINRVSDYCDPNADSCAASAGAPSVTYSWSTAPYDPTVGEIMLLTVVDPAGRTTRWSMASNAHLTGDGSGPGGMKSPSATADDTIITYKYYGQGPYESLVTRVSSVTHRGKTWNYDILHYNSSQPTIKVTDPLGNTRQVKSDLLISQVLTDTDGLNRTVSYQYDSFGRRTRITYPEGNFSQFTYDARGNITEGRAVAKPGSGLPDIVTSAVYPAMCANPKTCNKPISTTDALGRVTDYTYDPIHGGVLTVTAPAAVAGGVRPQTRYSYTAVYAWFMNSSGVLVQAATPIYKLTGVSTCRTTSSCAGTADEVKTTLAYQGGSASAGSNLLLTSISQSAGDGSAVATTATTYDMIGNALTVDGPMAGPSDTVRTRYDSLRRIVGVVGPDPDGAGPLKNRALRHSYNVDGQLSLVERGTVNSQSDADWNAFATLEQRNIGYDAIGRKATDSLIAGGSTVALTQYSYDEGSRLECVAQRMNPAAFGSLPASACSLGASGNFGFDRISKTIYDAADQVTKVQTGVGTSVQRDESTSTYSGNGRLLTLTDAKGNKTTYEYDGFDRLSRTRFPSPTQVGTSSTSDYEQFTYDAMANATQKRLRDGQLISYSYDQLGRLSTKTLPGSEAGVTYGYDNLGQPTSAAQAGHTLSFSYDALGRMLTQSGPQGTLTSQYDVAGRRTRLTWADAFHVTYDYLMTGEMTVVRENGAASGIGVLATFTYDNLGRRTSLTRGNGTVTGYSYDSASRLWQLTQDLAATAADQTLGFSYTPAGQITSRTSSNDFYAWTQSSNVNRPYTSNGLNQYSTAGSASFSYDGRGNLTSTGDGGTYGYSSENLLITAPGSATLSYDPLRRLYQVTASATTRFTYDGADLVAEYNASNQMLRRYVHGPGVDEPVVWYEGSGTTDRRWLHADERGSIIAISNASGSSLTINRYDEYGVSQSTNQGRFQYTGQALISEAALYYFKTRFYSAGLGRFMQTDPIGYGGGMNLYAYVRGDPVNQRDPSGLIEQVIVSGTRDCYDCTSYSWDEFTSFYGFFSSIDWLSDLDEQAGTVGEMQEQQTRCPAVPSAPADADIQANMRAAAARNPVNGGVNPQSGSWINPVATLVWFNGQVRYGAPWDYKTQGSQYEDFGNFNFGATGIKAGFSEDTLLRAAGYAQRSHPQAPQFPGDPGNPASILFVPGAGTPPNGDDPRDQQMIQLGAQYARNGC